MSTDELVGRLQDLHAGPEALPAIVAVGAAAVPALERLLRGPSQSLYQPRTWAADALAAIGGPPAVTALIRALHDCSSRTPDPLSLQAEDVVVSRIAEHLSNHPGPAVVDALLDALRERPYPGCVRALGQLGDERAIPALIQCLYEDAARGPAVQALRRFGGAAVIAMRAVVAMPYRVAGLEPPVFALGRAAATALLGELQDRHTLMCALGDDERGVRVAAALALVDRERAAAPSLAVRVLLAALDDPDWRSAQPVLQTLAGYGRALTSALLALLAQRPQDEPGLRRRRRAALLAGQMHLAEAVAPLACLYDAADSELRLAAVHALAQIPAASTRQLARFLFDALPQTALRALEALSARLDHTTSDDAPAARQSLPSVRQIAAWLALTPLGGSCWHRAWRAMRLWVLAARARRARSRDHEPSHPRGPPDVPRGDRYNSASGASRRRRPPSPAEEPTA